MIYFASTELEVLIESLEYSKERVRNAADTALSVRQENLTRLDSVQAKLRGFRQEIISDGRQNV